MPKKQLSPYLVVLTMGKPLCDVFSSKSDRTLTFSLRWMVVTGDAMMSLAQYNSNSTLIKEI